MMLVSPVAMGDAWVKVVGRMQVETVAFMTRRTLAAFELPQTLSRCTTPQEMMAEQVRYWQIAQRQYLQSVEKVAAAVPLTAAALATASTAAPAPAATVRPARDYMLVPNGRAAAPVHPAPVAPAPVAPAHATPAHVAPAHAASAAGHVHVLPPTSAPPVAVTAAAGHGHAMSAMRDAAPQRDVLGVDTETPTPRFKRTA
jgi:hypothetical protein